MRIIHEPAIQAADATATQKSAPFDVGMCQMFGASFSVIGLTGTSLTVSAEGSNDIPPSGALLNNGWVPAETSWTAIPGGSGEQTVTTDGVFPVGGSVYFRWLRLKSVPSSVTAGTVSAVLFAQGGA